MNRLITPVIFIQEEQKKKANLNFDNEKSREHRELAAEDIKSAKELFALTKDVKYQNDKSTVKGLKRKVVQNAMESTEHSFKAVNCADEDKKVISHNDLKQRERLDNSHNLVFLQRVQEEPGIRIISKEDAISLKKIVQDKNGNSPYNAVRYSKQNFYDDSVQRFINIAEKALQNVEKMAKSQHDKVFKLSNGSVCKLEY